MKKLILPALVLCLAMSVTSCSKDDDPAPLTTLPAENAPIAKTFFPGAFNIVSSGSGTYEYGFKFSVLKAGKITKLGTKMPTASTYQVTLWDASVTPATVLAQSSVVQSAAQTPTFNSITAVAVTPGKDYFVTLWSNTNWYEIRPATGTTITYPITTGNIQVKGYSWIGSATASPAKFPTNNETTYVAGVADFEYQADPF